MPVEVIRGLDQYGHPNDALVICLKLIELGLQLVRASSGVLPVRNLFPGAQLPAPVLDHAQAHRVIEHKHDFTAVVTT